MDSKTSEIKTFSSDEHEEWIQSDIGYILFSMGSSSFQCGYASIEYPMIIIPCIVGRPKYEAVLPPCLQIGVQIGDEAQRHRSVLHLVSPIQHGLVTDWDACEKIWRHSIDREIRGRHLPDRCVVIMVTVPPLQPKAQQQKLRRLLFEKFQFPHVVLKEESELILLASGKTTGIVVSSGSGVTFVAPFYQGYSLQQGVRRLDVGGDDLTTYLERLLTPKYPDVHHNTNLVEKIKHQMCYVNRLPLLVPMEMSFETRIKSFKVGTFLFTMPDGNVLRMSQSDCSQCGEAVFHPSLMGADFPGLHQLIDASIRTCDLEIWSELFGAVILAGGNTVMQGLGDRLVQELEKLAPQGVRVAVVGLDRRGIQASVWVGGAISAKQGGLYGRLDRKDGKEEWEKEQDRQSIAQEKELQATVVVGCMVRRVGGGIGFKLPLFLLRHVWEFIHVCPERYLRTGEMVGEHSWWGSCLKAHIHNL